MENESVKRTKSGKKLMILGFVSIAILFLMFDVETVFLSPWAVAMKDLGTMGLVTVTFFIVILALGLAYAWKKGALEWK